MQTTVWQLALDLCPDIVVLAILCGMLFISACSYQWFYGRRRSTKHLAEQRVQSDFVPLFAGLVIAGTLGQCAITLFCTRYIAVTVPLLYLLLADAVSSLGIFRRKFQFLLIALVGINVVNQSGALLPQLDQDSPTFQRLTDKAFERSGEYRRFHNSNVNACRFIENHHSSSSIIVTAPFGHLLALPRLGYVTRPLQGIDLDDAKNVSGFRKNAGPSEIRDPIFLVERLFAQHALPPFENADDLLFDDGILPSLRVFRKRWQARPPENCAELAEWFSRRQWPGSSLAKRAILRAYWQKQCGQHRAAAKELAAIIKCDSANEELRLQAIRYLSAVGLLPQATELVESGLQIQPASVALSIELARILSQQGKQLEAITQLEELIRIHRDAIDAYFMLASLHMQQHAPVEAIRYLDLCVAENPEAYVARISAAQILIQQRELGEAETRLRACVIQRPNDGEAWYYLGAVYVAQGNQPLARKSLRRALETPLRPELRQNVVRLLDNSQRGGVSTDRAIRNFR